MATSNTTSGENDTIRAALGLPSLPTISSTGASGTPTGANDYGSAGGGGHYLSQFISPNTVRLFDEMAKTKNLAEAKKNDKPTPTELLQAFKTDQASVAKANQEQRNKQLAAMTQWETMLSPEGPIQGLNKQAADLKTSMIAPIQQFTSEGLDWLEQARERARELGPKTEAAATQAKAFVVQAKENALDTYKNESAKVAMLKVSNLWQEFNEQADMYRQQHSADMTPDQIEQNVYQMKMSTLQQSSMLGAQLDIQYETSKSSMNQAYDELIANATHLADWKTSTAYSAGADEETKIATVAASMKQTALQWVEQAEVQSARLTELATTLFARGLEASANFLVSLDSYVDPFLSDLYIYGEALSELNYQPQYRSVSGHRASGKKGGVVASQPIQQRALGVTPTGTSAASRTAGTPQQTIGPTNVPVQESQPNWSNPDYKYLS